MAFSFKWLGQGGFELMLGSERLIIDPYLSDSVVKSDGFKRLLPLPVEPSALPVGMIACTHDHTDHLDPDTISATDFATHTYAGPSDCLRHFRELGIPKDRLIRFSKGDVLHLGDARLMAVPAEHTAPEAIGIVVEYNGIRMYFTGDTLYNTWLRDVGSMCIDILFVCINGQLGNMDYKQAAQLARELPCRAVVPNHYGMFAENTIDPALFVSEISGSGIYVHLPEFNRETNVMDVLGRAMHG